MTCKKCGAELKPGCIFCSQCGAEIQMVPDYNILEDEVFFAMEEEERRKEEEKKKENEQKKAEEKKRKKKRNTLILILVLIAVAIILVTALIVMTNRNRQLNSYDYQMQSAQEAYANEEYSEALSCLKQALTLEGDSIEARLLMADIYVAQKEYEDAITVLNEILQLDEENAKAYEKLIEIYNAQDDYDSLIELAEQTDNEELLSLFEGYIIEGPVVSVEGGEFDDLFTVTLEAPEDDYTIYYTLNGKTPTEKSTKYEGEEIEIEDGETTLKAVCYSEDGRYSLVTEEVYQVDLEAPEGASISPESGTYTQPTQITITVQDGAQAYYTLDGSTPTAASTKYEGPFDMPEGNNILSVIVIKNGLSSNVESRSYIYIPE